MSEKVRRHIFISGRVQGVFFRDSMKAVADREGVTGWVRNLPDRRVEALLEGGAEPVEKVIEWSWRGPSSARVDQVEVIEEVFKEEFFEFDIVFSRRW